MKRPFRALLLAAGLGTRLRPITLHTPKCLVPIGGEPLLSRWLKQLERAGCEAALVNTHYLASQTEVDWFFSGQAPSLTSEAGYHPGLIQSLSQGLLPGLSAWVEVGGIAPFPCLKAPLPQPIST